MAPGDKMRAGAGGKAPPAGRLVAQSASSEEAGGQQTLCVVFSFFTCLPYFSFQNIKGIVIPVP